MKVLEFPWAYLVVGTASVESARRALGRRLGGSRRKAVGQMPCRPLAHPEHGPCVAFYFAVGPGGEQKYKP